MTPDRATIEASTPKCPKHEIKVEQVDTVVSGNVPIVTATCSGLLAWDHTKELWRCDEHGPQITAQAISRRQHVERYA